MPLIALKIDVDTYRGTREGVPRLAALLERLGVRATFLFSVGPDHTGRALRRAFRPGFMRKVQRTSVLQHYGLRTLLYGVLLPGPHIARRCAAEMRAVAQAGFEVGVHTYDHVRWQDGVARATEAWTRRELERACAAFAEVFRHPARVHGAAGWQMNSAVPALEAALGIRYASDTRGSSPFRPLVRTQVSDVPQLPTTLPTLDELIGTPDLVGGNAVAHLLAASDQARHAQVFTLHAELEGGAFLPQFERLVRGWRTQGHEVTDLAGYAARLDFASLPACPILEASVPGRSGTLACQGPPAPA